jgi:hypothetical protein
MKVSQKVPEVRDDSYVEPLTEERQVYRVEHPALGEL